MPVIETPIFADLRPFEELSVATKVGETAAEATDRGAAGGLHRNAFSAMVGHLCFFEDAPLPAAAAAATDEAPGKKRSHRGASAEATGENPRDSVRVSLIAHVEAGTARRKDKDAEMEEDTERPAPVSTRTITLASWTFGPATTQHKARTHKSSKTDAQATAGSAASSSAQDGAGEEDGAVGVGHLSFHAMCLKVPLLFRSDAGAVRSLAVVAHTVPAEPATGTAPTKRGEGERADGGVKLKPYTGQRRFAVRLCGMQQTELTQEQVVLLSS